MQQLIGAWKLLFINVTGGTSTYGNHPLGRIIFTPQGYMNAMVTNPDKTLTNGTSWAKASEHEIATIAKQMVAYSGPYTVQNISGDIYTHVSVEISMNPSWLGTDQVRHASLEEKDGRKRDQVYEHTGLGEDDSANVDGMRDVDITAVHY